MSFKVGDRVKFSAEGVVARIGNDTTNTVVDVRWGNGKVNSFSKDSLDKYAEVIPEPIKVGDKFRWPESECVYEIIKIEENRTIYTYLDVGGNLQAGANNISSWKRYERVEEA